MKRGGFRMWRLVLLALWGGAAIPAGAVSNPSVYVAMGDGITYGSVYDITPWPARLDLLLGSGKTVVNKGKAASRVGYGSAKVNEWLAAYDPGYLLILYGSNDLGMHYSTDYIIGELRTIIRAAKANGTVPVVGTLPPIFVEGVGGQSTLNSRIRQLAAEQGIQCADVSAVFSNRRSLLMDDGLHPTSQGQQLIAQTFYQAILASPAPVSLELSPRSANITDSGVAGATFNVTATMAWQAEAGQPWITVVQGTGTGAGTVIYNVAPNSGSSRTGTIRVTGAGSVQTFTVQQAAASLRVTPEVCCVPRAGATGLVVSVTANQPWTAVANEPWISLRSGASGAGNGQVVCDVAANAGSVRTGSVTVTVGGVTRRSAVVNQWPAPAVPGAGTESDFDGDGTADPATFRPANGEWNIRFANGVIWRVPWGWSAVHPVPADYDGDGIGDIAVYHPAGGTWYILQSADGRTRTESFGWSATFPLPGDYDGDGQADLAVFHRPTARWYFRYSQGGPDASVGFGWSAVLPVPADYDGDGVFDLAVYHPAGGCWYYCESSSGDVVEAAWGGASAVPVPADYDGDGAADLAVFNRKTAAWNIWYSGGGDWVQPFGWSAVVPVPADYDGDGRADVAVYHPAGGNGYIRESSTTATVTVPMGGAGHNPVLLNPRLHSWYQLP